MQGYGFSNVRRGLFLGSTLAIATGQIWHLGQKEP